MGLAKTPYALDDYVTLGKMAKLDFSDTATSTTLDDFVIAVQSGSLVDFLFHKGTAFDGTSPTIDIKDAAGNVLVASATIAPGSTTDVRASYYATADVELHVVFVRPSDNTAGRCVIGISFFTDPGTDSVSIS